MKFFPKFLQLDKVEPFSVDPERERQLIEILVKSVEFESKSEIPSGYLIEDNDYVVVDPENYGLMQRKYMDEGWRLRPNTSLHHASGELYFQINEAGLKGSKLDPNRKKVVVWGDSVVFGIGRGWVDHASDKEYLFLNGGAEGSPADAIMKNALEKNSKFSFDINVFSLGWHSKHDIKLVEKILEQSIQLPNVVLMTMPYSLSLELAGKDLSREFQINSSFQDAYLFWGNHAYSIKTATRLVKEIIKQNQLTRSFAEKNKIPLLDFEALMVSERTSATFKRSFFDLGHPRPEIYPFLTESLKDIVKVLP